MRVQNPRIAIRGSNRQTLRLDLRAEKAVAHGTLRSAKPVECVHRARLGPARRAASPRSSPCPPSIVPSIAAWIPKIAHIGGMLVM